MWRIIKERTNKTTQRDKENIELNINGTSIKEPREIANKFNNYFASIGHIGDSSSNNITTSNRVINSIYLSQVSLKEIHGILSNLKNKQSCGIDEIPPKLLKKCADELTLPFYLLVNQSFSEGCFPDLLKMAIIKPIHKKQSRNDPNNYRPIALLPTSSKIFEKAMCSRVYTYCEKYKLLDEAQCGFRKNHTTTLAVYKYIDKILGILEKKDYAVGLLLDMSKAYDKVQHDILLKKLRDIGIRGLAHKWFESYLQNRLQCVEIESFNYSTGYIQKTRSDIHQVTSSIPQGSVTGSLLFLIYINDLPQHVNTNIINTQCVLFADDISLLMPSGSSNDAIEQIQNTLANVSNWMVNHSLEINYTKTKIMSFRPHQKPALNIQATFNNIALEQVETFSLLGVNIDTHLNFKHHIQKIKSKLSSFTYALRELKTTTDLPSALAAYYAFIHSHLSFSIILWGNSTDAQHLFILQKKCVRILVNIKKRESCKPHFKNLKILTMPSIYILEMCKFVRKYPYFYNNLDDLPRRYALRPGRNKIIKPRSQLKMHSNGPHIMSIKIYNKLPIEVKNIQKDSLFAKTLKSYLIDKTYYDIKEYLD